MRVKTVNRYYCDYCKKSGCAAGHMKKHERSCTMNPERVCGMCKMLNIVQKPIAELKSFLVGMTSDNAEKLINKLREANVGCPACTLAALRQGGTHDFYTPYNYSKDVQDMWAEINAANADYY